MWTKTLKNITAVDGDSFDANITFVREDNSGSFDKSFHIAVGNISTVDQVKQIAQDEADGLQALDDLNNSLKNLIGTQI